jgi:predicted O-methyltransferase YrrM
MPLLYLLARTFGRSGTIVECGVGRGCSTVALLAGAIEGDTCMWSIDPSPCKSLAMHTGRLGEISESVLNHYWMFLQVPNRETAEKFADSSVGLFFLDTSHDYEETKAELAVWLPKIHPQGVMCGHDYLHTNPQYAGVKRAVDEFAQAHKDRFHLRVHHPDQGLFLLWPNSVDC